jgi:hypothetical protein
MTPEPDVEAYSAALPARVRGAAARHQSRSPRDTGIGLEARRARLVEALATAPATPPLHLTKMPRRVAQPSNGYAERLRR